MIIKKTVRTSLLILALICQSTSLYGMFSRFVATIPRFALQKSTGQSSIKLLNLMTRRRYCGSGKGTDLLSATQKDRASIKESVDRMDRPEKWYQSFPVGVLSIPIAFLLHEYGTNWISRYYLKQDSNDYVCSVCDGSKEIQENLKDD